MRNIENAQLNSFEGGMNKDDSPESMETNQYLHAENLLFISRDAIDTGLGGDILTDPSSAVRHGSNFRLGNIPGDLEWFSLTNTPIVSKYRVCVDVTDPELAYSVTVNITYQPPNNGTPVVYSYTGTVEQVWAAINAQQIGGNNIFYATTKCDCIDIRVRLWDAGINLVTVTGLVNATFTITNNSLPAQTDLVILGYATSDMELVLITTSANNTNPDEGGVPNIGQVWRIPIDSMGVPTISFEDALIYNDRINTSLIHQCKVLYTPETECIKRVTWADGFNDIRSLNIADPDSRFLTPDLTLLSPASELAEITFTGHTSGQLKHGVYVYFIRLTNRAAGIRTKIGPPSQKVNVLFRSPSESQYLDYVRTRSFTTDQPEESPFYFDVGTPTNIGNVLEINNIDTEYDTIELIAAYFTTGFGNPASVYIAIRTDITGATMVLNHTSDTIQYEEVTAEEIALQGASVKSPKSILENNRRLLAINYCEGTQLDFPQGNFLNAPSGFTITATEIDWAIRSDNHPDSVSQISGGNYDIYSTNRVTGLVSTTTSTGAVLSNPGGDFNIEDDYPDFKGAEVEYWMRGYMRGDWYRFGIVFFLPDGTRTPVYWIGDYLFSNPDTSFVHDDGTLTNPYWANQKGIRFSGLDLSSVASQISGFSIVRSKRAGRVQGKGIINRFSTGVPGESHSRFFSPTFDFSVKLPLLGGLYNFDVYYEVRDIIASPPPGLQFAKLYERVPITPFTFPSTGYSYSSEQQTLGGVGVPVSTSARTTLNTNFPADLELNRTYYAALVDDTLVPFGGTGDAQLAGTQYFWTGHFQPVDDCNTGDGNYVYDVRISGGDVFACNYSRKRDVSLFDLVTTQGVSGTVNADILTSPVEADTNLLLRACADPVNTTYPEVDVVIEKREVFEVREVFMRYDSGVPLFGFSSSQNCQSCFPNRIIATQPKIPGEIFNAWALFQSNEVYDVDIKHGSLTEVDTIQDGTQSVIFWQEGAFGIIPTSAQAITASGAEIVIGTGQLFSRHQYVSEEYGCQHQWSVSRGQSRFVWVDVNKRAILRYGEDGFNNLSDSAKMQSFADVVLGNFIDKDNPIHLGGLHTSYDYLHNIIVITASNPFTPTEGNENPDNSGWTLIYTDAQKAFTSFWSATPRLWMTIPGNRLLSQGIKRDGSVYQHFATPNVRNVFYGVGFIEPEEGADIPTTSYVSRLIYLLNKQGKYRQKNLSYFSADMNNVWSSVQVATGDIYASIATTLLPLQSYKRRMRGELSTQRWQPRSGKWFGPAPYLTDLYTEGDGWADNTILTPPVSELFFIGLLCNFTDKRDIGSIATIYTDNTVNT